MKRRRFCFDAVFLRYLVTGELVPSSGPDTTSYLTCPEEMTTEH